MSAAEPLAEVQIAVPRGRQCAAVAREVVDRELVGRVDDDVVVSALLVVSELVSNAYVHGAGAIEVRLLQGEGRVRLEVADQGRGGATAIRERDSAGGWGLRVVDTVASDWGVEDAGATRVWVELPTDALA